MYQVSNSFLQAMDDISRTLAVEVEISGVQYPTDTIIRFDLERGVFDNDIFTIGQTMSNVLTLEIFTNPIIQTGDELKLFTSLRVGEKDERVPLGVYYVDSTAINKEKMTLTCYDKMVTLIDEYIPSANHTTLAALFEDVLSQIGMTYDGVFHDVPIKAPLHGYTYRETLGFIASLNGGNMVVNRAGHLEIQRFQTVERSIPAKACFSFEVKEPYRVSKVFCQFGDVGITRGDSSGQCVAFENPYVTEQNIDTIYNLLNGLSFTAATLNYRGDLTLDPGDVFQFTDYKGDIYPLMCGRNKLTFNGGLSGQLDSIGESENSNTYTELQLKYKKNITKLTAELGKIQGVVQEIEQSHDGLEERVTEAESKITADAITNTVKQNFYTKNELTSSGTCNLLKNGGFENGTNYWSRNGNFTDGPDSWLPYGTGESWVIWADNARCGFYQFFNCTVGKQYSWSLDIYIERGQVQGGIENINTHWYDADSGWVKMSGTFTATSTSHAFIIYSTVNNTVFHVDNAMVNEGAIPLPFQPNYLEVDENITNLTQRVTEAESKITADAITNTVKQSFYTKAETESAITSKGYATESQLQQTANNITSTVSQNYYTKQETENTINNKNFATKSEVQQTADSITYKFSQSGGYNLIKNGGFENGTTHWIRNGNFTDDKDVWSPYGNGTSWVIWADAWSGFYQFFNCRVGQTYSWSMDVYVEHGYFRAGVEDISEEWYRADNGWVKMKGTFTATRESHAFILYAAENHTAVHVDNIMVCEGDIPSSYTPHPSEIYEGITTIDRDGIKVTASNINGHTEMTSGGFYVNKDGGDVFKVDSNGLSLRGCGANSGRYIKIENEDYTVWNNNINCLRFGYKNWNGWDGVPEFLMGYKGFRYSETANTGEDASYFGMQTWGRNVRSNPNAYHEIYYRSDKFGDTSYIRFDEDGTVDYRSLGQTVIKCEASGHGIALAKYGGKDLSYVRPTLHNATDLGHESYRYRTIYATNGSINTSDISLKENINPIVSKAETPMLLIDDAKVALSSEDYYEFVKILPMYTYDYKSKDDEENRALHNVGFIAQDVADTPVGNEFIFKGEDGVYQYNMQGYVGVLAVALQNAIKEIETLKEEIRQLKTTF